MKIPDPIVVDFETEAIEPRPHYPPAPVSVAIGNYRISGRKGLNHFFAWGHPTENNSSATEANSILTAVWDDPRPKLFHNAKFDLDVAETHLDLPWLPWNVVHDTLFLAFLANPHRAKLSLKELATEELGIPPTERDAVKAWILENVPGATPKTWGAYISKAPGNLVGRYAIGDVTRPIALFKKLYPKILDQEMSDAYDRERRLLAPLIDSERRGIYVDLKRIRADSKTYAAAVERADNHIRKILSAPELDVGSAPQLADALEDSGAVTKWIMTKKGNRSTSKKNLEAALDNRDIFQLLAYRSAIATNLSHFINPWKRMAEETGGFIHTTWNQVRQDYHNAGNREVGARTGRLSSTPNFQNITKVFEESELAEKLEGFKYEKWGLPEPPRIRSYIKPRPGHVLIGRDYSQQELRILAHYEDGVLKRAYVDNYNEWLANPKTPWLDQHEFARTLINNLLGTAFKRKPIKNTGFGLIYGMGLGKLAAAIKEAVEVAKKVRDAYLAIFPGLKTLTKELKRRGKANEPIRTWGGRVYHVEPPRIVEGRGIVTFEYKLTNYLIQGSAADCTKEAVCRYWELDEKRLGHLLLTAHDELLAEVPIGLWQREMEAMRIVMESVEFDVPMLSDGKWSKKSWGEMTPIPLAKERWLTEKEL